LNDDEYAVSSNLEETKQTFQNIKYTIFTLTYVQIITQNNKNRYQ